MSLILSGTAGLSDVDGSAATPAIRGTDTNTGLFFPAADTVGIATGGTERLRLDSSGNLGLGVTPSAWSLTNSSALQIRNAGFMGFSNSAYFTANAYNSAGTWRYIASESAGQYAINKNVHEWYIAASGTAGNAITFTQAMTLDASGRLSVGTTSTTKMLEVQGSVGYLAAFRNNSSTATTSYINVINANNVNAGLVMAHIDDGTGYFGTQNNAALRFVTNDTERARIDSSGNLLVGVTSGAGNRLFVKGEGSTSSTYAVNVENSGGNTMFRIRNDYQSVIYGAYSFTTASAANVNVDSTGALARSTSALKYKQDVRNLESVNISAFRPVRYKSKCENDDQTKDHIGLIADDYVDSFPELVQLGAEGEVEGFAYERLTVVLLKALQEQQALIASQSEIITQLQADVAALKAKA